MDILPLQDPLCGHRDAVFGQYAEPILNKFYSEYRFEINGVKGCCRSRRERTFL